ncbi:MAG: ABC-2 family transporter protein [Parachlamydiaceae bacterium]|nr:ABC-2 family transporter protein [Parachlamydiaceae bacterium]
MREAFKKMLKLEWAFFKLSAIADLQVPFNLGLQFVNDILWYTMQIILFEALYLHVDRLGGWGIVEMRVFLGVLFLVDAFQMVLFAHNFDVFSEKIVHRDLDLYLLRPVSSQQMMTSQKLQCGFILNGIFAFAWLLWSLSLLPGGFPWMRSLLIFIVVPAGLAIFYSTRLLFCTITLLMTRAEHFHEFYFTFFRMGQRPDHLYGPGIRYIILLIIPVGMIAGFPTRVLVDPTDNWALPALLTVAVISFLVANLFWRWSVKRYMTIG